MRTQALLLLTSLISQGLIGSQSLINAAENARRALVIGNSRYEANVGALRNASTDAKAMARALRQLGFSVSERHDLTRDEFLKALDDFRRTLAGTGVGLFFYAGHGVSIGGVNYLVPIRSGFDPQSADSTALRMLAETRLFNAEQVVADMSAAGAACNVIILDACRNTPLARSNRDRNFGKSGGLAEMTPPAGTLIAFATDAGHVASDGAGTNGLYTSELLKHLLVPGLTIEQVFKRTRAGVMALSDGAQVPAEYSRLIGEDIYLAGTRSDVTANVSSPREASLPSMQELEALAGTGRYQECLKELGRAVHSGSKQGAEVVLDIVLEGVKENLKSNLSSEQLGEQAEICRAVIELLPECLSLDDPLAQSLAAKAYNRRGDALLDLGQPDKAFSDFNTAIPLAPNDAYIVYNRGRAYLAMGMKAEARKDFTEAMSTRFNQPKARKLAQEALSLTE